MEAGKTPQNKPASLPGSFTKDLLEKAQKRQTVKDVLFMLALGFKNILQGFFKVDTVQKLEENRQEKK